MSMRRADFMDKPGRSILSVRDLSIRFNGRPILEHVSFDLYPGRRTLLVGPSGCGKTSVFRVLMGLIRPESGEITVRDHKMDRYTIGAIRTMIGYVPQEPDIGDITVRQFLEQPFAYKANHNRSLNRDHLQYWMDFFGLSSSLLDQSCSSLSGGQKQRFAVVLAILLDRDIILLDEPTSAMDAPSRQALRQWISGETNRTFFIVSHDPELQTLMQETIDIEIYCGARP